MRATLAFEIARDKIHHAFDTQNPEITIGAEDVLHKKEGICSTFIIGNNSSGNFSKYSRAIF